MKRGGLKSLGSIKWWYSVESVGISDIWSGGIACRKQHWTEQSGRGVQNRILDVLPNSWLLLYCLLYKLLFLSYPINPAGQYIFTGVLARHVLPLRSHLLRGICSPPVHASPTHFSRTHLYTELLEPNIHLFPRYLHLDDISSTATRIGRIVSHM